MIATEFLNLDSLISSPFPEVKILHVGGVSLLSCLLENTRYSSSFESSRLLCLARIDRGFVIDASLVPYCCFPRQLLFLLLICFNCNKPFFLIFRGQGKKWSSNGDSRGGNDPRVFSSFDDSRGNRMDHFLVILEF